MTKQHDLDVGRIPRLFGQHGQPDPVAYAKFFASESGTSWYVCEVNSESDDPRLYCFVQDRNEGDWQFVALSRLNSIGARQVPGFLPSPLRTVVEQDYNVRPHFGVM